MIRALYFLIDSLITIYIWIIIVAVVLSWLVGFNVINPYNQFVRSLQTFCYRATEPLLGRIRRFMPDLGGLDISPVIAILLLQAFNILVRSVLIQGRLL